MPLFRFLFIAIAVWLAVAIIRRLYDSRARRKTGTLPSYTSMVACHHCGVHIPRPTALNQAGRFYCSAQHLAADSREPQG